LVRLLPPYRVLGGHRGYENNSDEGSNRQVTTMASSIGFDNEIDPSG
jgi:hypothetical protein